MTRIEVQGGGIVNTYNDISGTAGAPTITTADWWDQLAGYLAPVNQLNSPMSFTIADSNLADFSDAAVFVHPDRRMPSTSTGPAPPADHRRRAHRADPQRPGRRAGLPLHVQRHDLELRPGRAHQLPDRQRLQRRQRLPGRSSRTARSTTIRYAIQTVAPAHSDGPRQQLRQRRAAGDERHLRRLDDASPWTSWDHRRGPRGQNAFSQLQYNLFYNNNTNIVSTTNRRRLRGQRGRELRQSRLRRPGRRSLDATAENFELESEFAGDRRRPQRDRAAGRRQRDLPGHRPVPLETARSSAPARIPTRLPRRRSAGQDRPVRRVRSATSSATNQFFGDLRFAPDHDLAGLGRIQLPRPMGSRS